MTKPSQQLSRNRAIRDFPRNSCARKQRRARKSPNVRRVVGGWGDGGVAGAGRRRDVRGRRRRAPARRRRRDRARWCSTPRSSGYQEILTDPSYAGQIITFTYPHIGNYGVNERRRRERARRGAGASSCATSRAGRRTGARPTTSTASSTRHEVAGIAGIDTRRLTRHIRERRRDPRRVRHRRSRHAARGRAGRRRHRRPRPRRAWSRPPSRTRSVPTTRASTSWRTTSGSSVRSSTSSSRAGCQVEVVPAGTTGAEVLAREPDGVFLSNGPGDPAAVDRRGRRRAAAARQRAGVRHLPRAPDHEPRPRRATRSSCASATTAATTPCAISSTGRVEITSQNHNYAVDADSLPEGSVVTHLNLNDGDVEGRP